VDISAGIATDETFKFLLSEFFAVPLFADEVHDPVHNSTLSLPFSP
jgi:hypothetical protein